MKQKKKILVRIEIGVIVALLLVLAVVLNIRRRTDTADHKESTASVADLPGSKTGDSGPDGEMEKTQSQTAQSEMAQPPETVQLTVSAAGDCTLGKDEAAAYGTSLNAFYDARGASYFLEDVKDVFAGDDLTITNMEGTLTDSDAIVEKSFNFKADAAYADILTEGSVEAVNLANNHSHDYGEEGYTDTVEALDAAGIVNFGYERTAAMTIMAAVSGCGVGTGSATGTVKLDPDHPVSLTIWHYYNGAQQATFDELVDEFNATEGKEQGVYVEGTARDRSLIWRQPLTARSGEK